MVFIMTSQHIEIRERANDVFFQLHQWACLGRCMEGTKLAKGVG